jgi:hypothetical protein
MTKHRLYEFLASSELGLTTTAFFVILYCWPLLTFTRSSTTFVYYFVVWGLHVALIALMRFASDRATPVDPVVSANQPGQE